VLVKLDGIVAIARLDRLAVFVPALLLGLSGCVSLGSEAIQGSRTQYNLALLETDDEQLLLNLVRLRYRDRVLFLEASSLTTQFNFTATAGVAYGYQSNARENSVVRGGVVVQEKPTVTYAPLQGRDFVERVLSRISLETLLLLSGSGWNPERVFRVCIERMNGLRNATHADGPTPDMAPSFEEFVRATRLLRELRDQDMFSGARGPVEDAPVLRFRPEAAKLAEYQEFTRLLRLDPGRRVYSFENSLDRLDGETLNIRTRSFLGVMYFLSQSVEVPDRDIQAGRVTITRDENGQPFDWSRVTGGLMQVRTSVEQPESAAVAVRYRDRWFYIDDSDLDSKSTFSLLGQIYALQSGDVSSAAPLLTLPVGN
jgi:hypothetical protein